jgi:hypothetical protein
MNLLYLRLFQITCSFNQGTRYHPLQQQQLFQHGEAAATTTTDAVRDKICSSTDHLSRMPPAQGKGGLHLWPTSDMLSYIPSACTAASSVGHTSYQLHRHGT